MSLSVYYLDDEVALCSIFRDIFSSPEITITTFTDASDAIAACSENPPHIMFIDMTLADTTGDKVAQAIDSSICKLLITGDLYHNTGDLFHASFEKPFDLAKINSLLTEKLASYS